MKKSYRRAVILIFILNCIILSSYAQEDLLDRVIRQGIVIDSLEKDVSVYQNLNKDYQFKNQQLKDSLFNLNSELYKLNTFRFERESVKVQLAQKNDSISLLRSELTEKEKVLAEQQIKTIEQVKKAEESGKQSIKSILINFYKNKSFDDLVLSSAQQSLEKDRELIDPNRELGPILYDLEQYFKAKKLLEIKYEEIAINEAQNNLSRINRKSQTIDNLLANIENYQLVNNGLIETIDQIINLDKNESVINLNPEVQQLKFKKIMVIISNYIFSYDFEFKDYPYLSDLILKIIKLKKPNPDADISEILQQL